MKIIQWNALSIRKHSNEMQQFLRSFNTPPDIICISETYLKPPQTYTLSDYEILRKDRDGDFQGGGVAILIKTGINFKNINLKFNKIEGIAIEIFTNNNNKLTVVNVYDPPVQLVDLEDYAQVFSIGGRVVVTGDFNAHNPLWKSEQMDRRGRCIEDMLEDYDFTMLNTGQPTYQKAHGGTSVLDLSFVSSAMAGRCEWSVGNSTLGSDHVPTIIDIDVFNAEKNSTVKWKLESAE